MQPLNSNQSGKGKPLTRAFAGRYEGRVRNEVRGYISCKLAIKGGERFVQLTTLLVSCKQRVEKRSKAQCARQHSRQAWSSLHSHASADTQASHTLLNPAQT